MITLNAKKREITGKQVGDLRKKGLLPGVVYGPKTENANVEIDSKEFAAVLKQAGESSLIELALGNSKLPVLIKDLFYDPLTSQPAHVDFYAPNMKEETEVTVPLVFVGESAAVKDLKGDLVKNIQEIDIKCLPTEIPHEINVDISSLATFEDKICIKDLKVSEKIKVLNGAEEIVVFVQAHKDVEAELAATIEEKVEEVGKVEKEKTEDQILDEQGVPASPAKE
ncbi:MAG TPA: 50S ribosomal protein L25 [Candidatus Pacearchaeota archaeon]|nr:50S ribosomal protein L25 [Candidatus Pacearchaeota archaeon]